MLLDQVEGNLTKKGQNYITCQLRMWDETEPRYASSKGVRLQLMAMGYG